MPRSGNVLKNSKNRRTLTNVRQIMRKHHCGANAPLLKEFVENCIQVSEGSRVKSQELYEAYQDWLSKMTDNDEQTKYLSTFIRFCRQIHSNLPGNARRVRLEGKMAFSGISLSRAKRLPNRSCKVENPLIIEAKTLEDCSEVPIKVQKVHDERGAGFCAFASRTIQKGEVVTEFKGEVVTMEEIDRREKFYRSRGKIQATLVVSQYNKPDIAIDPLAITPIPVGARINHSKRNANLKPVQVEDIDGKPRVFFVAKSYIPEGVELLFNYGDEEASFFENSQTIPSR